MTGTIFYDSSSPEEIPPEAKYAAVYVNGYVTPAAQVRRFTGGVFRISVLPEAYWARLARCIDVERGAATPADARAFITERHALGKGDATVYCSRLSIPAVQAACEGLDYRIWAADWTGVPHEVPGAWAVQFATVTGKYDESVVSGDADFCRP
jgi:hypothetical protein